MSASAIFKKLYPLISVGASFAGPVGSMAAGALGKALGVDVKADPQAMQDAIASAAMTEDGRLKLQQAENEFKETMTKLGFDDAEKLAQLAADDRDSARKREMTVKDRMPMILSICAVGVLVGSLLLLKFGGVSANTEGALLVLIGTVSAAFKDVYGYYFGSSAGADAAAAKVKVQ